MLQNGPCARARAGEELAQGWRAGRPGRPSEREAQHLLGSLETPRPQSLRPRGCQTRSDILCSAHAPEASAHPFLRGPWALGLSRTGLREEAWGPRHSTAWFSFKLTAASASCTSPASHSQEQQGEEMSQMELRPHGGPAGCEQWVQKQGQQWISERWAGVVSVCGALWGQQEPSWASG